MALFRALAVALLAACGGATEPNRDPTATFRILFVGNSLTYTNDLPGLLDALADSAGVERTYVESVAYPGFALEDHWAQGDAVAAIRRGGWTYVIMQQGPSALPESRVQLIAWSRQFASEIRAAGATPAFYTVWPSTDRSFDFPRVVESYQLAADSTGGLILPAGAAWLEAFRVDPNLRLYGLDGFHPSVEGTYLAAMTIFGRLYQRSVVGLPARVATGLGLLVVSDSAAAILQRAADVVNGR
jgi:hypothetical protein